MKFDSIQFLAVDYFLLNIRRCFGLGELAASIKTF